MLLNWKCIECMHRCALYIVWVIVWLLWIPYSYGFDRERCHETILDWEDLYDGFISYNTLGTWEICLGE